MPLPPSEYFKKAITPEKQLTTSLWCKRALMQLQGYRHSLEEKEGSVFKLRSTKSLLPLLVTKMSSHKKWLGRRGDRLQRKVSEG
eukprot:scaffold56363_cov13-Tisochrysis_lutea.AAC.1